MTPVSHDPTIPYAAEVVPGAVIDLSEWTCRAVREGDIVQYYAFGRCPACGARVQGRYDESERPIEGGRPEAAEGAFVADPMEVPVRCTCGASHGEAGATSCGRRWSILCPRPDE